MQDEMAGGRVLGGVAAGVGDGAGVPGLLGLLLAMEAGVPVPVPSDLVMLLLGERVSAGVLPLWLAALLLELVALAGTAALFLAARGPARALLTRVLPRLGQSGARRTHPVLRRVPRWGSVAERLGGEGPAVHRVLPALVAGRTTPGLRTVTVVAAASSRIRAGRALAALVLGSSLFLQVHLLLGYALGPAARELLERARLPLLVAAAVVLVAVATLLVRRRGRAARVLAEGACPACLALGFGLGRAAAEPTAAGSPGGGA
jgi:membrane protein DedA with SNARE-associated domain